MCKQRPLALTCGLDMDGSFYVASADPFDPNASATLAACCLSSYFPPFKAPPGYSGLDYVLITWRKEAQTCLCLRPLASRGFMRLSFALPSLAKHLGRAVMCPR